MANAGDIVVVDFPGVQGVKRRPAVVVSSDLYHQTRPDQIVALITSNLATANKPTDHILKDWQVAGLNLPSAMRTFLWTIPKSAIGSVIGRVSEGDWKAISECVELALATA